MDPDEGSYDGSAGTVPFHILPVRFFLKIAVVSNSIKFHFATQRQKCQNFAVKLTVETQQTGNTNTNPQQTAPPAGGAIALGGPLAVWFAAVEPLSR